MKFKLISIILLLGLFISNKTYAEKDTLCIVFFDTDSYEISSVQYSKLKEFVSFLDTVIVSKIMVHAYCDDRGEHMYNAELSMKRANSSKAKLISLNVDKLLIKEVIAKGEIALKETSRKIIDQRTNNRRAEISVKYKLKPTEVIIEKVEPLTKKVSILPELDFENLESGDKITLESILFGGNSAVFLSESYPALQKLGATMKSNPGYHIKILGHVCCGRSDGVDSKTGKHNLSEARANAVYDYLVKNGIKAERMSYQGLAGKFPTGRGAKADKRVEIEITKIED